MTKIFISYRRDDSRKDAGRIYDSLVKTFGKQSIFKDIDSIPLGTDFRGVLREAVAKCDVLIAIIGIKWLDIRDNDGKRRLDNLDDFVRIEIESALQRGITVVPVLVDNARMPSADDLPSTLQDLAFRNAINVRDDPDFHRDVKRLIEGIQEKLISQDGTRQITSSFTPWWKKPEYIVPILAAVIVGFLGLWQGVFANPQLPTPQPTTVAHNETETPTDVLTPTPTATNTLRPTNVSSPTNTNTPIPTNTLDPIQIALTPVTGGTDWTPVERDFDGVTMVLVPAGCFMMGSEEFTDAQVHEICFQQPFWIDKFEVTNGQFQRFSGTASMPSAVTNSDRPREQINWREARDFCLLREARLPTESEWEYAARGPDSLMYPWGNSFIGNASNNATNSQGMTTSVGSHPIGASWVGAEDMSGNVWEWVHTIYDFYGNQNNYPYPYATDDGRETLRDNVLRGVRGGSFLSNQNFVKSARRFRYDGNLRDNEVGFRCARDFVAD